MSDVVTLVVRFLMCASRIARFLTPIEGARAEETADTFGKRDALAVLHDVREQCRDEDMRIDHTEAAVAFLEAAATRRASFGAFTEALDITNPEGQVADVNSALSGIMRALSAMDRRQ